MEKYVIEKILMFVPGFESGATLMLVVGSTTWATHEYY